MPSYPKRMARNQEVGLKPISERQVLPLVSDFYEQKITNYLSHRAPWLHSGIIISTVLDIKGNSRENSHNTPTIFLSHVCPQNPRPVHQTSNPPKSLAVCSVSGISFNQSVWLRRENKSPSFKNLFSPTVFFMLFFQKKKNEKNNFPKSIKSARPSSHGSFLQEFDDRVLVVTCHQGLDKGDVQPKIPWHL